MGPEQSRRIEWWLWPSTSTLALSWRSSGLFRIVQCSAVQYEALLSLFPPETSPSSWHVSTPQGFVDTTAQSTQHALSRTATNQPTPRPTLTNPTQARLSLRRHDLRSESESKQNPDTLCNEPVVSAVAGEGKVRRRRGICRTLRMRKRTRR
jgi:hypothetical protein